MLLNKYGPSDSLLNFKYPKQSKKANFGQTNVIFEVIFQEVIHMKNPAYVPLKQGFLVINTVISGSRSNSYENRPRFRLKGIFWYKHCHNQGQEVIDIKNGPIPLKQALLDIKPVIIGVKE